jgi:hypothetical protein
MVAAIGELLLRHFSPASPATVTRGPDEGLESI